MYILSYAGAKTEICVYWNVRIKDQKIERWTTIDKNQSRNQKILDKDSQQKILK